MATEYVILRKVNDNGWIEEDKRVTAHGQRAAIRVILKGITENRNTYVAVPASSWKPETPEVETRTQLKFQ